MSAEGELAAQRRFVRQRHTLPVLAFCTRFSSTLIFTTFFCSMDACCFASARALYRSSRSRIISKPSSLLFLVSCALSNLSSMINHLLYSETSTPSSSSFEARGAGL